jgi:voltage-gated potassium channel
MSFARLVVQRCYALEDSLRYKWVKRFFYDLLENPQAPVRPFFDLGMILLVLASVFVLIYDVKNDLGLFGRLFEGLAVSIFLTEYLLRLWLYNDSHRILIEHYERAEFTNAPFRLGPAVREILAKKWDYMTTPLAVIDLLAIIPSYRPLRFLRIFLLFRLFKLFRYARSVNQFAQVLSEKRFEFQILFFFLFFVVFSSASVIYFFEASTEGGQIDTFFDAIYWALVTLSTVGYGDITPQTQEGRFVTLVLILCGIGVIAFTTSIIVAAFSEKMPEVRRSRVFAEVEKRGNHTILCGFGRIGQVVAERLVQDREHFVIVDSKAEHIALARQRGYLAIEGGAESTELLENLGVSAQARRILCLTSDDVTNVYITLLARHLNPDIEIISRANREETVNKLVQAGANHTVMPFKVAGLIASEYAGQPVAFEAIYGIFSGEEDISIETIPVHEGAALEGKTIGDIDFRQLRLILFGVISGRGRESMPEDSAYDLKGGRFLFNPGEGFVLKPNDVLVVFGHQFSIFHFKEQLEKGVAR